MNERFGEARVSMDFKRFGAAKPVQVPAASDAADMTDAVKKQGTKTA